MSEGSSKWMADVKDLPADARSGLWREVASLRGWELLLTSDDPPAIEWLANKVTAEHPVGPQVTRTAMSVLVEAGAAIGIKPEEVAS